MAVAVEIGNGQRIRHSRSDVIAAGREVTLPIAKGHRHHVARYFSVLGIDQGNCGRHNVEVAVSIYLG